MAAQLADVIISLMHVHSNRTVSHMISLLIMVLMAEDIVCQECESLP